MFGQHWHASETPFEMVFRWRADDGPLLVIFGSAHINSKETKTKNKQKKRCQSWTLSEKTFLDPRMDHHQLTSETPLDIQETV